MYLLYSARLADRPKAVPSRFAKTKAKLSFAFFVSASVATTVPSHFAKTKLLNPLVQACGIQYIIKSLSQEPIRFTISGL
jgi:hypothetical protein